MGVLYKTLLWSDMQSKLGPTLNQKSFLKRTQEPEQRGNQGQKPHRGPPLVQFHCCIDWQKKVQGQLGGIHWEAAWGKLFILRWSTVLMLSIKPPPKLMSPEATLKVISPWLKLLFLIFPRRRLFSPIKPSLSVFNLDCLSTEIKCWLHQELKFQQRSKLVSFSFMEELNPDTPAGPEKGRWQVLRSTKSPALLCQNQEPASRSSLGEVFRSPKSP